MTLFNLLETYTWKYDTDNGFSYSKGNSFNNFMNNHSDTIIDSLNIIIAIIIIIAVIGIIAAISLSAKAKNEPTWTGKAKVVDKYYSKESGYSITFDLENGERKPFVASEEDFKKFAVGDSGTLVCQKLIFDKYGIKSFTLDATDNQSVSDT